MKYVFFKSLRSYKTAANPNSNKLRNKIRKRTKLRPTHENPIAKLITNNCCYCIAYILRNIKIYLLFYSKQENTLNIN